jgi:rhamnosyltransferase
MTITILLRTLNAGADLPPLLERLAAQTLRPAELLAVDSGSTDGTRERLVAAGARIVMIEQERFSHARSTNQGFREAVGEVVAMLSQDALPADERWLETLTAPLADPNVAAAFGRHLARPGCFPIERWQVEDDYPPAPPAGVLYSNVNSAARRSAWLEAPFDESLAISEDRAWARAQLDRGRRIVYVPDAAAWHSHDYTIAAAGERCRAEAAARRVAEGVTEGVGLLFKAWPRQTLKDLARLAREGELRHGPRAAAYRWAQFRGMWAGGRPGA